MSARPYALALLAAGAASLAVLWDLPAALEVVVGATVLLYGVYKGDAVATTAAAWVLYLPVSYALGLLVPSVWNFVLGGLIVVFVSEMMSFELEFLAPLGSAKGVDRQVEALAGEVRLSHAREMASFILLVIPVMVASAVLASVTQYASEFFAAAILLFLVLLIYARR